MAKIETPAVTITAIGSGRKVILNQIGAPAVLIFHGRHTAEVSKAINTAVRDQHDASSVLIATIMDLHIAPRILHGVIEAFIKNAYEDACKQLPNGLRPYDYLILLPDWDGKLTKRFGFRDTDRTGAVAVLDRKGNVVGTYQGRDLVNQTMPLLQKSIEASS